MKKRVCFAILGTLVIWTPDTHAADIVASGTNCGSNCSWSFDTETGEVNVFLTNTSGDNPTGTVSSTPWTTTYKTSITKITADDSLSGNVKCNSCSNLTEVVLGKNITSIPSDAFSGTQLTHITIPADSKITTIGDRAFQNTNLESITIPNSVTAINSNAFNGTKLTSLVIPDSVMSGVIGCNNCSNLTEVVIGKNVTSINSDAFRGTKLTSITIPEDSKLTSIGDRAFQDTKIETINLPNTLKTINSNAFNGSSLTSLTIPDSVTSGSIGCNNCANLTEVVIGKNVTSIASDAFRGTQLTSIVIPADSKLTSIGDRAFWGTNIDSLTIPDSITTINSSAFYGVSLSKIECSEENLARYLATGGVFKEGASISCTGGSCENALKGTKWEGKVGVTYPTQEKPLANGGVAIFKNGEFVGYKGKRIYTIEEANAVTGIKNRVAIRYK